MYSLQITRIIPASYKRELTLINYVVGEAQSKNASKIIQSLLDDKANGKTFLKRIRKKAECPNIVEVIICEQGNRNQIQKLMAVKELINQTKILQLPKDPPLTIEQYQQWAKIWPVNFIKQEITREIVHSPQQTAFLMKMLQKQGSQFQFCLFKDQKVLLTKSGACQMGTIKHPIMQMLEQWPNSESFLAQSEKWYYLTGIKMFCRRSDLCGMCSMALVHSRLAAIYLQHAPSKTMDQIMSCPQLNHQIAMFLIK